MKLKTSLIYFLIGLLNLCLVSNHGYGQLTSSMPLFQSPNASSLGKYGSIDVSPFTGLADIGVDVFSLEEGDIPIKCRLRYNSGGVKPADHPGWVGQNWTLDVGGIVTRKVNGGTDEFDNSNASDPSHANDLAYYYHYDILNVDGSRSPLWYSSQFIEGYWPNNSSSPPVIPVLAPDEFVFSLPSGTSGSFYLNHLGNWVVKSKNGDDLKVNVVPNTQPIILYYVDPTTNTAGSLSSQISRAFYSIVITDHLGFVYTFGNQTDAIEFTRSGRTTNYSYSNNEDIVANAWHLTSIQSPKGYSVAFKYSRKLNQYVIHTCYPSSSVTSINFADNFLASSSFGAQVTSPKHGVVNVITPSYLSQITSSSFSVLFDISQTNELGYDYSQYAGNLLAGFELAGWNDLGLLDDNTPIGNQGYLPMWYKLNGISVNDMYGVLKQKFAFDYKDQSDSRLFLTDFRKVSLTTDPDLKYSFGYNTTVLPTYNDLQMDQWGYFNGITYEPTDDDNMLINYYLAMDPVKAQAGTLTSITYPTGGSTTFEYQANDYANFITKNGPNISLTSQSGIGGGLRIYRITDYDANGNFYPTTYKYVKASTGLSSGILAGLKKIHYTINFVGQGNSSASTSFYDLNTFNALDYTDGKDVVYSEVKKVLPDGSYTIYTYSNSDSNNGLDQSPINIYSDGYWSNITDPTTATSGANPSSYSYPFLAFSSMELERGLLTSQTDYTSTGQIVHQITNTYNTDPTRFNNYVRMYDNYTIQANGDGLSVNERYFQPIKIYTYYPYLQSHTEIHIDQSTGASQTTTSNYSYGLPAHRQIVETDVQNSDGNTFSTQSIYNLDIINATKTVSGLSSDQVTTITSAYNSKSMILPVQVTKFSNSNSVLTSTEQYNYNGSFWPSSYQASTWSNPLELRFQYLSYDSYGNILSAGKPNDVLSSFLYGYNNQYPIAKVINAVPADIAYSSFEDIYAATVQGNWSLVGAPQLDSTCPFGGYSFNLSSSTNVQVAGLTAATTYTVSYWSKNGSYTVSGSQPVIITGNSVNGWTYYQHTATGVTTLSITGNGSLDEVKLYPSGSQMTTYTYSPLFGMTTQTDSNNVTTYYDYDGFGRLLDIKDSDGNILKTFGYNYQTR